MQQQLRLVIIVLAVTFAGWTGAATFDRCRIYGFAPWSRAYAQCRLNLRHFWTTGPCGSARFAYTQPDYCHLWLPPFI